MMGPLNRGGLEILLTVGLGTTSLYHLSHTLDNPVPELHSNQWAVTFIPMPNHGTENGTCSSRYSKHVWKSDERTAQLVNPCPCPRQFVERTCKTNEHSRKFVESYLAGVWVWISQRYQAARDEGGLREIQQLYIDEHKLLIVMIIMDIMLIMTCCLHVSVCA